jgi:hypothetical protein
MKPAVIPPAVHFDEAFTAVHDLLKENGIHLVAPVEQDSKLLQYRASKLYSVVGLLPNHPAMPANLRQQISIKSALSTRRQQREAMIAGVDQFFQPHDFALLRAKFGERFDRFLLLNDAAVEACADCQCNFTFVGTIPQGSLLRPSTLLTCSYWS